MNYKMLLKVMGILFILCQPVLLFAEETSNNSPVDSLGEVVNLGSTQTSSAIDIDAVNGEVRITNAPDYTKITQGILSPGHGGGQAPTQNIESAIVNQRELLGLSGISGTLSGIREANGHKTLISDQTITSQFRDQGTFSGESYSSILINQTGGGGVTPVELNLEVEVPDTIIPVENPSGDGNTSGEQG